MGAEPAFERFGERTEFRGNDYYVDRQAERESNARTYARKFRLAIARASGVKVTDTDGKSYYDCLAGAGTFPLGHNHPAVIAAVRAQLDSGMPFQTLDMTTPVKHAFTEALFDSLPPEFAKRAKIQFCGPTGADAIEAAIKLVKTASGRSTMLAFRGAYHGMTHGALGISGNLGPKRRIGGLANDSQFLPFPHDYRCPLGIGGEPAHRANAQLLRTMLEDPEGGVLPAGLVLEAVQGEGGVIPAPDGWMREIRSITQAHDLPMIVDEVQTGWGRTGRLYAFEHSGAIPDVLVLSKAIGGGLPMSVIIYDERLDLWEPGAHAGTFRGNQLAMAAGLATLKVIREQDLPGHAVTMGARLTARLHEIQADFAVIGNVRGRGLMIGAEIVDPDGLPDAQGHPPADGAIAAAIQQECLRRGLIIELGGRFGAVARFLSPLIVTAEDIDAIAAIFRDSIAAVLSTRGAVRAH
jgi:diaminobutyrate-2-oxoglutarate transaminase